MSVAVVSIEGNVFFALGAAALARQSATVPVHTPELNTARTMALDYFNAQAALGVRSRRRGASDAPKVHANRGVYHKL